MPPPPPPLRKKACRCCVCAGCAKQLRRDQFSHNQLGKKNARLCKTCVDRKVAAGSPSAWRRLRPKQQALRHQAATSDTGALAVRPTRAAGGSTALAVRGGSKTVRTKTEVSEEVIKQADGSVVVRRVERSETLVEVYGKHAGKSGRGKFDKSVPRDRFGNVAGPEYDLSPDGTFKGQQVAVLQLYTGEGFSFASPKAALEKKGFAVQIWTALPPVAEFVAGIKRACQLWVISGATLSVTPEPDA